MNITIFTSFQVAFSKDVREMLAAAATDVVEKKPIN